MAKIICGVDDSGPSRSAVRVASALAEALDRQLVLLHAAKPTAPAEVGMGTYTYPPRVDVERVAAVGEQLLERLAFELGLPGDTEQRVELGHPSGVLAEAAVDPSVELVVVGIRRRGWLATAFLGSVSSEVVARAPCPVLVVPPGARLTSGPLVCAVDDSPAARNAVRVARRLGDALGVELVLAHAVASTTVPSAAAVPGASAELARDGRAWADELLARLASEHELGTDVRRRVAVGSEAEAIARVAGEARASLVVVGTRRRGPLKALLAGSLSFELRATCPRPVVMVQADARLPVRW